MKKAVHSAIRRVMAVTKASPPMLLCGSENWTWSYWSTVNGGRHRQMLAGQGVSQTWEAGESPQVVPARPSELESL